MLCGFSGKHRDILRKYQEILRLRGLHEAGDAEDPRPAMRSLAAEFPSALRELDRLPMVTIAARVAELERVERGESPVPDWVVVQLAVHAWLRLARHVKASGGVRRDGRRALEAIRESPDAEALGVVEGDVETMLAPPGGRIVPWVHRRVASAAGTTTEAVAAAFCPA
jgi:hypothetical protein